MADLRDLIKIGDKLSSDALKGGKWDTEAFLVASMIKLLQNNVVDMIPDSNLDEYTDYSKELLAVYMGNKTDENLKKYLAQIIQIITELYLTCDAGQKIIIVENIYRIVDMW